MTELTRVLLIDGDPPEALRDGYLLSLDGKPPKLFKNGVEEPLMNIKAAVKVVRSKEGYERFDGSTLRKHCQKGNVTERVKSGSEWFVSEPALWTWLETYYPNPRIPYTKKNGRKS